MKFPVNLSHVLATLAVLMTVCAPLLVPATAEARRGAAACGPRGCGAAACGPRGAPRSDAPVLPFGRPSGATSWW
ncbi:hypothetical protein GCM10007919_13120 [Rhizobium indigoferae]|nr:hypothetical protein GCM10007919_13120 [Rhizobium indigoferae]